ncbi:MAG: NAD-dependent epimerase/dehydratase family protein [Chitinophagaceae bacterium]|nr:MAG: NAD-dependent epimerase/dehydratase family protein [Chitinophagaceae bacterium]
MAGFKENTELELWGGIECTINRVNNVFFDQLQYSGHYNRPKDIDLLAGTGIRKVRYPVLWEKHQPEKNTVIDWTYTQERLSAIKSKGIDVIAGLVHHGSGPAFTDLLDPQFPHLLAAYAQKVAERFPWIEYYTPVNEPLTTARFSGLYGLWYPHEKNDRSFLKMLLNELKGTVLSMQAIRKINPAAKLVQTEDLGKIYSTKTLKYQADFENHRRWLTYDLLCGMVTPAHKLWKYFLKKGITKAELEFFIENPCVPDVFGFNHYLTSERFLDGRLNRYPKHTHGGNGRHRYADVEAVRMEMKEPIGIKVLLKEAWNRYKKPIAVTEVHLHCHREDQLRWFKHVWNSCEELRAEGVDIKAATAWAMLGSFGWNKLLTEASGDYEPGVFDIRNGTPRPTALARFIKQQSIAAHLQLLSNDKGWWLRPTRFFHKPIMLQNTINYAPECSAPLLIIGKNGTLGRAFAKCCEDRAIAYKLLSRQDCDICNEESIQAAIDEFRPWAIVNTAGYVRVDDAEREFDKCFYDNTKGAENLAIVTAKQGIRFITFSSDLVFDGKKTAPYVETDETSPLNIYGRTKAQAEAAVLKANPNALIIRTSAFFGPWDEYNFAHYVRRSLLNEETISVANDVVISPTYVPDLVHTSLDLLIDEESGIWHLANQGELTWGDFAYEIADRFGLNRKYIQLVANEEMNYPAKRPVYSVLTSTRGILLPTLDNALKRYTAEMKATLLKEKQQLRKARA